MLMSWFVLYVKAIGDGATFADSDPVSATGNTKSASGSLTMSFEDGAYPSSDWTVNKFTRNEASTNIEPHGGLYYGATTGAASAYLVTSNKVASPISITFWISKTSTNTTSSNWKIQVSANGEDWTDVLTRSASDMSRGEWVKVTQSLSDYSDVYVRVYYSGSTAVRAIDDLVLFYN